MNSEYRVAKTIPIIMILLYLLMSIPIIIFTLLNIKTIFIDIPVPVIGLFFIIFLMGYFVYRILLLLIHGIIFKITNKGVIVGNEWLLIDFDTVINIRKHNPNLPFLRAIIFDLKPGCRSVRLKAFPVAGSSGSKYIGIRFFFVRGGAREFARFFNEVTIAFQNYKKSGV